MAPADSAGQWARRSIAALPARFLGVVDRPGLASFLDAAAPALLVAQSIGRFGNYFNQELFKAATQSQAVPWGLEIDRRPQTGGIRGLHWWGRLLAGFRVFEELPAGRSGASSPLWAPPEPLCRGGSLPDRAGVVCAQSARTRPRQEGQRPSAACRRRDRALIRMRPHRAARRNSPSRQPDQPTANPRTGSHVSGGPGADLKAARVWSSFPTSRCER